MGGVVDTHQVSQALGQTGSYPSNSLDHAQMGGPRPSSNRLGHTTKQQQGDKTLKKEARRRTIFVPSEDTTVMTIHPGHAADTQALNDTFQMPHFRQQPREQTLKDLAPVCRPRISMARSAQKMPLQRRAETSINVPAMDRPGDGDGKENMPPKAVEHAAKRARGLVDKITAKPQLANLKRARPTAPASKPPAARPMTSSQPRPSEPKAQPTDTRAQKPTTQPITKKPAVWQSQRSSSRRRVCTSASPPAPSNFSRWKNTHPPVESRSARSMLAANSKLAQYPILSEDVSQPALYEDSWLSHQEVALTEVVNEIFQQNGKSRQDFAKDSTDLRARMMAHYHQPEVTTMYRRLQASIACGSLGRPRNSTNTVDLTHDLGLRRRYLSTLLDSYGEEHLRLAAEVVVGRQASSGADKQNPQLEASQALMDSRSDRRALTAFLETFFVRVEDNEPAPEGKSEATARWQRTMLRTYMLVWLLDQSKTSGLVESCLFKRTSSHKSSAAVLQTFCSLLNPTIGDPTRTLRQYDYELVHAQDLLEEVEYRIENIAVDLRDGVLLTGLVDVLLNSGLQLSKQLKIPCSGRAQKVHNVQVALEALRGDDEESTFNITAENIVDGHREKTLSLLWSLVSRWGLDRLVDWTELIRDLERTKPTLIPTNHALHEDPEQPTDPASLLHAWASAHSAHQNLHLPNLTTAFTNANAYTAILKNFTTFLPGAPTQTTHLPTLFRNLGFSKTFSIHLSTPSIPSPQTTLANLALLASRLLPLARDHAAAVSIQRAYRSHLTRVEMIKRLRALKLAYAAKAVVEAGERRVRAAVLVQRIWRGVLGERIRRLEAEVTEFQRLARGWGIRRVVMRGVKAREGLGYWWSYGEEVWRDAGF